MDIMTHFIKIDISNLMKKPFRLIAVIGLIYLVMTITVNFLFGFSYRNSINPYSDIVSLTLEGMAAVLFALAFKFHTVHLFYYAGIELMVFEHLYTAEIYSALFLSSLLFVLIMTENRKITGRHIVLALFLEILKLCLVIPYGTSEFFNYLGLNLFAMCTIGCINLVLKYAWSKKQDDGLNLDELKLTDRQKDCIKEIVLNNTTIKALAINHNISESAIKKDLAHIYRVLGVTGKADLKALFIGYRFD